MKYHGKRYRSCFEKYSIPSVKKCKKARTPVYEENDTNTNHHHIQSLHQMEKRLQKKLQFTSYSDLVPESIVALKTRNRRNKRNYTNIRRDHSTSFLRNHLPSKDQGMTVRGR